MDPDAHPEPEPIVDEKEKQVVPLWAYGMVVIAFLGCLFAAVSYMTFTSKNETVEKEVN